MTVNSLLHCFIFFCKLRCLPLVPRPSPIAMQKEHWFDELHLHLDKHAAKRNSFDPHNYSTTQQGRQDCHTHFAEEGMDLSKAPHTSQWRRRDLSSGSLTLTVQHLCTCALHLESPSLLSLLDILGGHQPQAHPLQGLIWLSWKKTAPAPLPWLPEHSSDSWDHSLSFSSPLFDVFPMPLAQRWKNCSPWYTKDLSNIPCLHPLEFYPPGG